eukprot:12720209-Heterocapsa_arctica.AAC.1
MHNVILHAGHHAVRDVADSHASPQQVAAFGPHPSPEAPAFPPPAGLAFEAAAFSSRSSRPCFITCAVSRWRAVNHS